MKKLVKLTRYLVARCRPPSLPGLYWHTGTPNFGDDINPSLFSLIANCSVRLQPTRSRPHYLGMGSILERATSSSVVIGSGFLRLPKEAFPTAANFVSVRGKLSRNYIISKHVPYIGDPMVLLDQVYKPSALKVRDLGVIPHVSEVKKFRNMCPKGVKIIDPALPPWEVIKSIAECERIMSQSLHGLIVADALNIPNLWLKPSDAMIGGEFKFLDYFSTLDVAKQSHPFSLNLVSSTLSKFSVGRYVFDKRKYLEAIRNAINVDPKFDNSNAS